MNLPYYDKSKFSFLCLAVAHSPFVSGSSSSTPPPPPLYPRGLSHLNVPVFFFSSFYFLRRAINSESCGSCRRAVHRRLISLSSSLTLFIPVLYLFSFYLCFFRHLFVWPRFISLLPSLATALSIFSSLSSFMSSFRCLSSSFIFQFSFTSSFC